jgi:hypothetical protein
VVQATQKKPAGQREAKMQRMRWFIRSATITLPLASTATPEGLSSCVNGPVASKNPNNDCPARVVTTPPGVTLRMRWFWVSATITLPLASTATPRGILNCAFVPEASKDPAVDCPAIVVTTPPGVTLRMRLLLESATITLPLASTATPEGLKNRALAPVASKNPAVDCPARVVTTPPGVTLRMRWFWVSATITLPLASTATP